MLLKCDFCAAIVDATVVSAYKDYEDASDTTGRYCFLKCPQCSRPFVTLETSADEVNWSDPQRLFPPTNLGENLAVPPSVLQVYREAKTCYNAGAYTAAAIMCRKTLEGLGNHHNLKSRNLSEALRQLRDKGIIENRLYEWADMLRISGNDAAHDGRLAISDKDARDMLDFTHALLEYVFTFQERFSEFKRRRAAAQGETQSIVS